jgi:hypothetical protein
MHPSMPTPPAPADRPLGTISMVLGIAAVPTLFCFGLGLPLGLAAVTTGAVALIRQRRPGGRAIAGVALGLVAVTVAVILIARPDSQ